MPLLYLTGVLWGVSGLILVYVFYAKSSSMVENLFAVLSGVFLLLCQFYLCKLFAGVDEEGAAKRAFVTGIFAWCSPSATPFPTWCCFCWGAPTRGKSPRGRRRPAGGGPVSAGVPGHLPQVQLAAHPQRGRGSPAQPAMAGPAKKGLSQSPPARALFARFSAGQWRARQDFCPDRANEKKRPRVLPRLSKGKEKGAARSSSFFTMGAKDVNLYTI